MNRLVLAIALASCSCRSPEATLQARVGSSLRAFGYTAYTPFRTTDYPGTLFVMTRDYLGHWTEMVVSSFTRVFDVPVDQVFDTKGEEVALYDSLSQAQTFSLDASLDALKPIIDVNALASFATSATIRLQAPQIRHHADIAHLSTLRTHLSEETRLFLTDRKALGDLQSIYIVVETVTVSGIAISISIQDKAQVGLVADKLRGVLDSRADIKASSDGSITVAVDKPIMIGFKAARLGSGILETLIASGSPLSICAPEEFPVDGR